VFPSACDARSVPLPRLIRRRTKAASVAKAARSCGSDAGLAAVFDIEQPPSLSSRGGDTSLTPASAAPSGPASPRALQSRLHVQEFCGVGGGHAEIDAQISSPGPNDIAPLKSQLELA